MGAIHIAPRASDSGDQTPIMRLNPLGPWNVVSPDGSRFHLQRHEVTGGNPDRLEALLSLYRQMLPQYTQYLDVMRQRALRQQDSAIGPVEHQWLFELDGAPVGMTVFKYLPRRDCGLGLDLAVLPEFRDFRHSSLGQLGEMINRLSLWQLAQDSAAAGRTAPYGLLAEVESERLVAHYTRRYGFVQLPITYHEPPRVQAQGQAAEFKREAFREMFLGIFPSDGRSANLTEPATLINLVSALLIDHYQLPDNHWAVRAAVHSITDFK